MSNRERLGSRLGFILLSAGCAIGMAVKGKCSTRALNVSELQSILKKHGAFIGI